MSESKVGILITLFKTRQVKNTLFLSSWFLIAQKVQLDKEKLATDRQQKLTFLNWLGYREIIIFMCSNAKIYPQEQLKHLLSTYCHQVKTQCWRY